MYVQKLQPAVAQVKNSAVTKKQNATKALSKIALNDIKAKVMMNSLANEVAKSNQTQLNAKPINRDIDFLFMGFAC